MEGLCRIIACTTFFSMVAELLWSYFFQRPLFRGLPTTWVHFLSDFMIALLFYQESRLLHYKNLNRFQEGVITKSV